MKSSFTKSTSSRLLLGLLVMFLMIVRASATPSSFDNVANAAEMAGSTIFYAVTVNDNTLEQGETTTPPGMTQTVWFKVTPYTNGALTTAGLYSIQFNVDWAPPDNPEVEPIRSAGGVAIYTGNPTAGNAGLTLVASGICDPNKSLPDLTVNLASGTTYYFQVSCDKQFARASLYLEYKTKAFAINNGLESADVIDGNDVTYSRKTYAESVATTPVLPAESLSGVAQHTVSNIWLWWTPDHDGLYTIDTVGSTNDGSTTATNTCMAIFTGQHYVDLVKVAENDQNPSNGNEAAFVSGVFRAGVRYAIEIGANVGPSGVSESRTFRLRLKEIPDTAPPEASLLSSIDGGKSADAGHPGTTRKFVYKGLVRDNVIAKPRLTVTNSLGVVSTVENGVDKGASSSNAGWNECEWTAYLFPGQNTVTLYAIDGALNESVKLIESPFVAGPAPVTIAVDDDLHGSVTSAYKGTTLHTLGSTLTVKATPKAGYVFSAWTGSVTSTSSTITFVTDLQTNLQANFIASPFVALVGNYEGVFDAGTTVETNGKWRIALNGFGSFSGYTTLNGRRVALIGSFDNSGNFTKTYKTGLKAPLDQQTLTLSLNLATGEVTGSININAVVATLSAYRLPHYSASSPAPFTGGYTLALRPENPAPSPEPPQGTGYALVTVGKTGGVRVSGKLANGVAFTTSSYLNEVDEVAIGFVITKGYLRGVLGFNDALGHSDIEGALTHMRPVVAVPRASDTWVSGFTTTLTAVGNRYVAPLKGFRFMGSLDVNLGLATASLGGSSPVTTDVFVSSTNAVTQSPATALAFRMTVISRSGYVYGTFLDSTTTPALKRSFYGVVLQKDNLVSGFYLSNTPFGVRTSEPFSLTPR